MQGLTQLAAATLLGDDPAAFRQLFARTAELSPQRRYQAEKRMLERGLNHARNCRGNALVDLYVLLAGTAVEVLERTPAEPVLLNYAGVIFYELWSLEAARTLFLAARRLDPDLPHLADNLAAVKTRARNQRAQPGQRDQLAQRTQPARQNHRDRSRGRRPAPLHPALADLERRVARLADRARPATDLRLSLCMIVKDEEEMLGRCLEAAAPAVDEIVVVDTGSSDRTIEIAHEYGALVIEREWTGSFAEARNVSFDAASGDWILYLDADEVLVADDVAHLRALRGQTWREGFFLHETNFTGHEEAGVAVVHSALRVIRNRPEYRFSGRLHEQIAATLPTYLPERLCQSPVRIDHYGYLGSVRDAKAKSARNVELLLNARADGGPVGPFEHFNLGSEYMALERFGDAASEFERAWRLVTTGSGAAASGHFVPSLSARLVSALRQAGRPRQALKVADEALARFPDFTDLVFLQGLSWLDLGDGAAACERMRRAVEMGDAPSRYTAIVGSGTVLPQIVLAEQHLRDDEPEAALELLRSCAHSHPRFVGTYHPYLLALLAAGYHADEALAEIVGGLGDHANSTIHFMLATALVEGGAPAEATAQLKLTLARRPDNVPALELLAETLLMRQEFEEFAEVLTRLEAAELSPRERRERLAQMYLRHGYLRSAAREWMAVLDTSPDGAALRGLAEVARRNGQDAAARTFSTEALKYLS